MPDQKRGLVDSLAGEVIGPLMEKLEPVVIDKLLQTFDGKQIFLDVEGHTITATLSVAKKG